MSPSPHSGTEEYWQTLIRCLAEGCPLGGDHRDCPLAEFRKLPLQERLRHLEAFPPELRQYLHDYHFVCEAAHQAGLIQD